MSISDRMLRMHNCVGINVNTKDGFNGEIFNCFKEDSDSFTDAHDFLNIVNAFLDTLDFPAQKIRYRAFKKTLHTLKLIDIDPESKLFGTDKLLELIDDNGYVLLIIGRDNATWQGMVYSKAEDKEYRFNSEVELLRIINK